MGPKSDTQPAIRSLSHGQAGRRFRFLRGRPRQSGHAILYTRQHLKVCLLMMTAPPSPPFTALLPHLAPRKKQASRYISTPYPTTQGRRQGGSSVWKLTGPGKNNVTEGDGESAMKQPGPCPITPRETDHWKVWSMNQDFQKHCNASLLNSNN